MLARRVLRQVLAFATLLALLLALLQVAFFGLLIAAQAVPDEQIVEHLAQDIDDDLYGPTGRPDEMGGIAATHSECVMAGTGLGRPDDSVFERAVCLPRISSCASGDEDIEALRAGRTVDTVTDYFRYWGGFTILTRPALALWGLGGSACCAGLYSPSPRRSGRRPLPA